MFSNEKFKYDDIDGSFNFDANGDLEEISSDDQTKYTNQYFLPARVSALLRGAAHSLAVKKDNNHTPLKMGGDHDQLLFLLSNTITGRLSDDFRFVKEDNCYFLEIPSLTSEELSNGNYSKRKSFNVKDIKAVRVALNQFVASNPIPNYTTDQVKDPAFIRSLSPQTTELKLLAFGLESANEGVRRLQVKKSAYDIAAASLDPQIRNVQNAFLNELGISEEEHNNLLDNINLNTHSNQFMITNHTVYGPQLAELNAQKDNIYNSLFGAYEYAPLQAVINLPEYIALFVGRVCISIDALVNFNLDVKLSGVNLLNQKFDEAKV